MLINLSPVCIVIFKGTKFTTFTSLYYGIKCSRNWQYIETVSTAVQTGHLLHGMFVFEVLPKNKP